MFHIGWKLATGLGVFTGLVLLLIVTPTGSVFGDDTGRDFSPIEDRVKLPSRLESTLEQLLNAQQQGGPPEARKFAQARAVELTDQGVQVIAEVRPGAMKDAIQAATSAGAAIEATYGDLLQARVPVGSLKQLAAAEPILFVRAPLKAEPDAIKGEGVDVIGASSWHASGSDGAGTKIAILDLGFGGYQDLLGTELPTAVTARSFIANGDISGGGDVHGTAAAEIVHEVAPAAQLYLVNFKTEVEMGNAVSWLINEGVHVISFSLGNILSGPGDGTGPYNDIVNRATSSGIIWVSSAGNYADQHWSGRWNSTDGDGWHNFTGTSEVNSISASAGETIVVYLKWDDPWGGSCNDYDLFLLNNTPTIVAGSTQAQACHQYPIEAVSYQVPTSGTYHVGIWQHSSSRAPLFQLYSPTHRLSLQVPDASLTIPGDNRNVLTVGAVPWNSPSTIEPFSSRGPTADGRVKPDLVAPDRVRNVVYGTFTGTSAAAPHVAGAAALVKSAFPSYSSGQIKAFLEGRAVDLGNTGKDNTYGSGRLSLGVPPDSTSPNGRITSPAGGTQVTNCPVTITAEASDTGSGVNRVQFWGLYDGSWHDMGTDTNGGDGWSVSWACGGVGDQEITFSIHVWDNAGNRTIDAGGYSRVALTKLPFSGRITLPASGDTISACPTSILASATSTTRVQFWAFYDNGWHDLGTDTNPTDGWGVTWDCGAVANQSVTLSTHMWDATGNMHTDPGGYVRVTLTKTPFSGRISSPSGGATISACPLTIQAAGSNISKVRFWALYDGSWHDLGTDDNGADGWRIVWDCTAVGNKSVMLTAHMWDTGGTLHLDPGGWVPVTLSLTQFSGRISSPSGGTAVTTCPLTIQATANGVTKVRFWALYDATWHDLGTDTNGVDGWSVSWDCSSVSNQQIILTTHMWDTDGNVHLDPGGYVLLTLNRPTFSGRISSPANGATISSCPTTIQATASSVSKVRFFAFYEEVWHDLGTDTNGADGWSVAWDCSRVGDQQVNLTTHMWDSNGSLHTDPSGFVWVSLKRQGVWILSNYSHYVDNIDYLHVVGEVQNSTSDNLDLVKLTANFYNSAGQLVDTDNAYTWLDNLPTGTRTCFEFSLPKPANWHSYRFEAPTFYSDGKPLPRLAILGVSGTYKSTYRWYELMGQIRNDHGARVEYVQPVGTLYDAAGTVIGCDFTSVNSTHLDPGQSSSFKMTFSGRDYADATSYRVQVDGTTR